jgi:hypothetical protein
MLEKGGSAPRLLFPITSTYDLSRFPTLDDGSSAAPAPVHNGLRVMNGYGMVACRQSGRWDAEIIQFGG